MRLRDIAANHVADEDGVGADIDLRHRRAFDIGRDILDDRASVRADAVLDTVERIIML